MPPPELDLARLQRRQHGVFTTEQAITAGFTPSQIETEVARGRWTALRRGLYILSGVPVTWEARLLGDCLLTGGVASHRSAAACLDVLGFNRGRREITVARKQHGSLPGTIVHTSTDLDRARVVVVSGIPVTAPERLVVDLGGVVSFGRYARGIEDLMARRVMTWEDAAKALRAHERRGRRGIAAARALLLERFGTEIDESPLERLFDEFRRAFDLPEPERQHEIHDGADFVARVDFAYVPERVAIEMDSYRWHLNHEAFEADREKRNQLESMGRSVLALTKRMLVTAPSRSAHRILDALEIGSRRDP